VEQKDQHRASNPHSVAYSGPVDQSICRRTHEGQNGAGRPLCGRRFQSPAAACLILVLHALSLCRSVALSLSLCTWLCAHWNWFGATSLADRTLAGLAGLDEQAIEPTVQGVNLASVFDSPADLPAQFKTKRAFSQIGRCNCGIYATRDGPTQECGGNAWCASKQ
jgi:hypothetical protein